MIENDWPTEFVYVDGCRLSIHDIGAGGHPAMVFLHGIGCTKAIWTPVIRRLPSSWRFVPIDIRGGGESEETEPSDLTLAEWAADVIAVFEHLDLAEPPVLVGHSLGASIALQCALDHPSSVAGLVLLGAEAGLCRLGPMMRERARAIEDEGFDQWVNGPWRSAPPMSSRSREANPGLVDEYSTMLYVTGAEKYIRCVEGIAGSPDLTARLGEITVPVLVMIGGEDDRTLPEYGRALAKGLPESRTVELPGVGHTLQMESPDRVASEMAAFVAELAGSRKARS